MLDNTCPCNKKWPQKQEGSEYPASTSLPNCVAKTQLSLAMNHLSRMCTPNVWRFPWVCTKATHKR